MEACSKLIIKGNGKIEFSQNSFMKIEEGAILVFENINENLIFDTSKVIIPTGCINPYDILPEKYIISNIESWENKEYFINNNLIIESRAKLTISNNCNLTFNENSTIILEPGAQLILDNSTITNHSCSDTWQGIIVEGDASLPQYPYTNQGYVKVTNSTIENANTGIKSTNGGIVVAQNSTFINNIFDISIKDYQGVDNKYNYSRIENCTFKTTEDYYTSGNWIAKYDIELARTNIMRIKGNTFVYEADANRDFAYRGTGIYALSTDLDISPYCNCSVIPCSESCKTRNEFIGLQKGIYSISPGNSGYINIDDNQFVESQYGIILGNDDFVSVTRNSFTVPTFGTGLYIDNCTGFTVEENLFRGNKDKTSGIVVRNSGLKSNEIYNNDFHGLQTACQAHGINGDRSPRDNGLDFTCNEFIENQFAIFVSEYTPHHEDEMTVEIPEMKYLKPSSEYGISGYQGSYKLSAGNKFIQNGRDIINEAAFLLYFFDGSEYSIPERSHGNLEIEHSLEINECPSHLTNNIYNEDDIIAKKIEIETKEAELSAVIDGGNTEELNTIVEESDNHNALELRNILLS